MNDNFQFQTSGSAKYSDSLIKIYADDRSDLDRYAFKLSLGVLIALAQAEILEKVLDIQMDISDIERICRK